MNKCPMLQRVTVTLVTALINGRGKDTEVHFWLLLSDSISIYCTFAILITL